MAVLAAPGLGSVTTSTSSPTASVWTWRSSIEQLLYTFEQKQPDTSLWMVGAGRLERWTGVDNDRWEISRSSRSPWLKNVFINYDRRIPSFFGEKS